MLARLIKAAAGEVEDRTGANKDVPVAAGGTTPYTDEASKEEGDVIVFQGSFLSNMFGFIPQSTNIDAASMHLYAPGIKKNQDALQKMRAEYRAVSNAFRDGGFGFARTERWVTEVGAVKPGKRTPWLCNAFEAFQPHPNSEYRADMFLVHNLVEGAGAEAPMAIYGEDVFLRLRHEQLDESGKDCNV